MNIELVLNVPSLFIGVDSKENVVTRAVTFNDTVIGDTTTIGLFRVRFTDGALFAWRTPAMADIKPLELANILQEVAAQIINRYGENHEH